MFIQTFEINSSFVLHFNMSQNRYDRQKAKGVFFVTRHTAKCNFFNLNGNLQTMLWILRPGMIWYDIKEVDSRYA